MIEFIYCLSALNLILVGVIVRQYLVIKKMKSRPESVELQEFLADFMSGGGLVHVKRVAPADIVLRSRR